MPFDTQDAAPRVCMATLPQEDAATIKVAAGETAAGEDIVIRFQGCMLLPEQ